MSHKKRKNQEILTKKKRKGYRGTKRNLGMKKREWADTLSNKVNKNKDYVDKLIIACKEYMMIKKIHQEWLEHRKIQQKN